MRHSIAIALLLAAAIVCSADPLPVAPRETGPSPENHWSPRIVASGGDFVVVWGFERPRFARIRHTDEIRDAGELGRPGTPLAAVAGPNGSVFVALAEGDGIRIARIAYGGDVQVSDVVAPTFSSMAWNGTRLLFVTREGHTIFTDENGRIVGQGATLVLGQHGASASVRGNGFAVAWGDGSTIHVATLTNAGAVSREQTIPSQFGGQMSITCTNASTCLLLTPYFARVLGTASIGSEIKLTDVYVEPFAPVWDGQRFLVAWGKDGTTQVAGITPNGSVTSVAALPPPASFDRHSPVLAYAGGETVVAWTEELRCTFAGSQIVARSLATNRELRLTHGLPGQGEPAIAAGTDTALVAWVERGGTTRVRARVFPFTGPALDVSDGPAASSPVIGTDGTNYLVAWQESLSDDFCRKALRISIAGSGAVHTLAHGVDTGVQIAWNGSEYVVLWEQDEPTQLFAVRVDRSGRPIDSVPVPVTLPEEYRSFFAIDHEPAGLFWTGDGYLLVWRRSSILTVPLYPPPPPEIDVRTTRLGPDLTPAGTSQSIASSYPLHAAMKGGTIAALWYAGGTLHAARLSPQGTVLETRALEVDERDPLRLIPTRTGYAILTYTEILTLGDDLSLTGRRPLQHGQTTLAGTPAGVYEVYVDGGSVYLTPPEVRRRRPTTPGGRG